MKGIILITVLFTCATSVSSAEDIQEKISKFFPNFEESNDNLTVLEGWQKFEKRIKDIVNMGVKTGLPLLMNYSTKLNLSKECMRNSIHLISGLKNVKPWALRFIDSSAKIVDGIMFGSFSNIGAYDECIDTEVKSTKLMDKGKLLYRGQYCTIDMKPPLPPRKKTFKFDEIPDELKNFSTGDTFVSYSAKTIAYFHYLSLRLGICTPSGCSLEDINKIAKLVGNALSLKAKAKRCEVKEERNYSPLVIAVITCYSFAGLLFVVGSLIDIYAYYKKITFKNTFIRVLTAFSFFTNFRKFVNTNTSSDALRCLNGVRFLCMTWIILGHTYLNLNMQIIQGLNKVKGIIGTFAFQAILNASVSVDTFFCIGGLLVCYLTIKLVRDQGKKINVGLYIFHRIFRILPVYVFVILFLFLHQFLGSGPIWYDSTNMHTKPCYYNWWTNLLFINNFYNAKDMCLFHSWYIASDFQLYIGALLILLPMIRWPKVGILLSILTILASIFYTGIKTYVKNYPPAMTFTDPAPLIEYWAYFYFRPFMHASPYCIGILSGYLLATKPDLKIPPLIQVVGWSLAFISSFSVLYGVVEWNRGVEPTFWGSMFYASLNRTAWTLGVAWMIVCCATGHGGVINYILSWKVFIPLGRLTFVAYLVHPIVQVAAIGSFKTLIQADHFVPVWLFFGHLCVSYGVAFAGSMLIEAPFLNLEKLIFPRGGKAGKDCSLVKENSILNGTLKTEKNGDIIIIPLTDEEAVKGNSTLNGTLKTENSGDIVLIPKTDEESEGIDNRCATYKL